MRARLGKAALLLVLSCAPVRAEDITLLALGDSLTQGYGLPEEAGFVPQMQGWLRDHGAAVRVINAGVSGDTTAGGAARVGWSLSEDVDAMILALGANDMLRGIDPRISRENLAEILQVAQDADLPVLLIGFQAPGNLGEDYRREFDAIYPDLAAQFEVAFAPNFFAGLADLGPADWPSYFQPDRIHPNAKGVALITAALGPAVLELMSEE